MSENISNKIPEKILKNISNKMPDKIPEIILNRMPKNISKDMPEHYQKICQIEYQIKC